MSGSATTPTTCPNCGKKYNLPGDATGRKAHCKACHETFKVVPAASAAADTIKVRCECGRALKVPATASGQDARCPECQATISIPGPAGAEQVDAADADPFADQDLLAELSGGEALEQPRIDQVSMTCGKCGASTPAGPVCSVCGADPVSLSVDPAAASGGGADMSAGGMRLGMGVAASLVAGAVGAAIWFAVALFMNRELALLAWGIGGLVGFAMAAGSQQSGFLHGAIAAVISAVSIVVGKAVAFFVVLMPFIAVIGAITQIDNPREALAAEWTQNYLDEDATDPKAAYQQASANARADVDALSDEEFWAEFRSKAATDYAWQDALDAIDEDTYPDEDDYRQAVFEKTGEFTGKYEAELADDTPEELEKRWMAWKDSSFVTEGVSVADFSTGFFTTRFHLWDILFIGLALLTAFRIGAEGLGG